MAKKRHGGLGRGLDALIPMAGKSVPDRGNEEEKAGSGRGISSENSGQEMDADDRSSGTGAGNSTGEIATPSGGDDGNIFGERKSGLSDGSSEDYSKGFSKENSFAGRESSGSGFSGDVRMLRLSQVDPNRSQPRSKFEEEALEELADSIRQFGVLQPILVQKKGSRYDIIAGERRWRASHKAGLKEIPAVVREYSDEEAVELSLIENIQREDLNPIEEAKAFKRLLDEFGLRQEDLAARVSKSRTAITNAVRLLKLDERVQEMIISEELSMGHARALIPVEIPEEQFILAKDIAERKLSVREVEKLVKKRLAMASKEAKDQDNKGGIRGEKESNGKDTDPALELAYRAIEERLKQSLGTKATIRHSGNGTGKIEIAFYSHEDLEQIVDLLT